MFMRALVGLFLLVPLLCTAAASTQRDSLPTQPDDGKIHLDVVVTPKSGPPVTGLRQEDFTILDNNVPRTITSFRALDRRKAHVEVILVVDAVNIAYINLVNERQGIDRFLRAEGGHLAQPMAVAIFTDKGLQFLGDLSDDGNALSASLEQQIIGIRNSNVARSAGFYGAVDRSSLSLKVLAQLAAFEAPRPGRKVILWVSPGWPLLASPTVQIDSKQQQRIFDNIVAFSTNLRQARITLYGIDPLGADDFGARTFLYEAYVKGVSKPSQINPGNLALQVLATQSGGLALSMSNDVASLLQKCLSDTDAYYELSFDPPSDAKRDEYHHLEIKLSQPGLTARTRQGYYAQPKL
jgi:VWFA-related protein